MTDGKVSDVRSNFGPGKVKLQSRGSQRVGEKETVNPYSTNGHSVSVRAADEICVLQSID